MEWYPIFMSNTKIVGTRRPARSSEGVIRQWMLRGVEVLRLKSSDRQPEYALGSRVVRQVACALSAGIFLTYRPAAKVRV
jgi:pyruvate kinase